MVASHERELILTHQQYQRLEETVQQDSEILVQFAHKEEELELQEESTAEARKEALRIKKLAENAEIMNPAKLAFDNSALWLGEDASQWNVAGQEYISSTEKQHESKYHNGRIETTKRERLLTGTSTPQSSVDLEWENEEGLSPPTHVSDDDDDDLVSDTASCLSQLSTPLSNGNEELEWDGHFTSTHISQLDIETERLISEIERMTSDALNSASQQR